MEHRPKLLIRNVDIFFAKAYCKVHTHGIDDVYKLII